MNSASQGDSHYVTAVGVSGLPARVDVPPRIARHPMRGQASIEYVVVCAALALALGLAASGPDSVLVQLRDAFRTAYARISFSLSLPN